MKRTDINNLGALKASGYETKSIKKELKDNLVLRLKNGLPSFEGVHGYQDTVIPEVERAILSSHNILLLGLRGQAKTRIARLFVHLLDDYIPIVSGTELNEDPFNPILKSTREMILDLKDDLPIEWMSKDLRFVEKLATPDVSIADLIGDIDPIKAVNNRWSYADERSIHYGLVPRSNRSIFVINELPDLQPRIQVSLFNILQEGDIQIRGFKIRLPLDVQFIFTANPEDYTNRGNIITPLKDRIDSQIITHYPTDIETSKLITLQEAKINEDLKSNVYLSPIIHNILERIAVQARLSEYVDEQSGVSARLTISALENLYSAAERRMIISGAEKTYVRISDLLSVIPSITGKVELVYEGEQEGLYNVALILIGQAIKEEFLHIFPDPELLDRKKAKDIYSPIKQFFSDGNALILMFNDSDQQMLEKYEETTGLFDIIKNYISRKEDIPVLMELVLHGLAELHIISREMLDDKVTFNDDLADILGDI